MEVVYTDLHIHTSRNSDALNNNYQVDVLLQKITEFSKGYRSLISLTDHNVINKKAYLDLNTKKSEEVNLILGVELHIRMHISKPAYHCHIYFDLTEITENVIDDINAILNELYPIKGVEKMDDSIPCIEAIINKFENYEFILVPHGGQSHATFNTAIMKGVRCDETIERTIYYNQIEGFSARGKERLEETKEYLKVLGIGDFVNLITGSDNYDPNNYPNTHGNPEQEFLPTWIYSKPSFDGLRLALSEESRLEYAVEPSFLDYRCIKSVKMESDKISIDVELTPGLNVVIGESSAGKSLFVDSLVKNIENKIEDSNYEKDFNVSNMDINNEIGTIPYYINQNFISESIRRNKDFNKIPIIEMLFPENEYSVELIDTNLNVVKQILNDLIGSVREIENAILQINKVPKLNNLILRGIIAGTTINCFKPSVLDKENMVYDDKDLERDKKILIDLKQKIHSNRLVTETIVEFDSLINKLNLLNEKYKFNKEIEACIDNNINIYRDSINENNEHNRMVTKNKSLLFENIEKYIINLKRFYEKLSMLSSYTFSVDTVKKEYGDNKFFIKNTLEITNEKIKDIFNKYLNNHKVTIQDINNIKPEELFANNYMSDVDGYSGFIDNVYKEISKLNKKIYKIETKDGKDFEKLSPGWRTAIVLDSILKYDVDNTPLIIDQPEDNLANTYINDGLIKALKEAKKKRQIIMVSHNATIPMLGDAQNIVLCKVEGDKIIIKSAALEDMLEGKKVIDIIAEITDGGKKSIKKRFKKYNFKKYKGE